MRDNKSHGLLLSEEPVPWQRRCRSVELTPRRNSAEALECSRRGRDRATEASGRRMLMLRRGRFGTK
ncbi:hypothetical protein BTZ20_0181 [Rhodococcus sp. MTM3W5.2]|nr:hypothetical protein BTZ20_0181 [Rhodococcus sp. MTM3W5.2]